MDAELREWLGLAPADFPVYLACLCLVLTYFVKGGILDTFLVLIAIGACIVSCFIGMKKDWRVSGFTNGAKLATYPICLVACIILSLINFKFWN